jgi:hypothetical protein
MGEACAASRMLKNHFDHSHSPYSLVKSGSGPDQEGGRNISEGHPFDVAQGKLSDSRQRGFLHLCTPHLFIPLLDRRVEVER